MENGEVTFNGMSSLNEYWNRASETDRSEIKTSSSDDSTDESKSSIKEYRDASCYVDFEEEFNELIVDEDESNIVEKSRDIIKLSESKTKKTLKLQSSRYVRWDVLMSLGLGLWAVLCIVDVLHSEEVAIGDWLVEFTRERRNISKSVLINKPESQKFEFHFWSYLWRILWIFFTGAAYILMILLLIVFCGDPRLRKTARKLAIENNVNTNISTAKEIDKFSVENKKTSSISKKSTNSRNVPKIVQKKIPVKLAPSTAINLHVRILTCVEQHFSHFDSLQTRNTVVKRKIENIATTLQSCNGRLSEYKKLFTDSQSLLGRLHMTNCKALKFVNIARKDVYYVAKASNSVCLMDASTSTYSIEKIHFEVEEYLRKTRKSSKSFNSLKTRIIESRRNSTELSTNGETTRRIITSSPAFKNFLLRLKHNSCIS